MPERRRHRGPHPADRRLFAADQQPRLRAATGDLSWLFTRGYAYPSSLKLVGDRYNLTRRQRIAIARCACSDNALAHRRGRETAVKDIAGRALLIDGFNVITTVEAALAGGVLLRGRDGCLRDMASMHGNYRKVEQTVPAIQRLVRTLTSLRPRRVTWYLDRPVSNSGRLKTHLLKQAPPHVQASAQPSAQPSAHPSEHATEHPSEHASRDASQNAPAWRVELVEDPDPLLIAAENASQQPVVVTADAGVLDACGPWLNLMPLVLAGLDEGVATPLELTGSR